MVLEKYIGTNEEKRLRELIKGMEVIGCLDTFSKYIKKCDKNISELSYLEIKLFDKMTSSLGDLRIKLRLLDVTDFKALTTDLLYHGAYGYDEQDLYEHLDYLVSYNDTTAHPHLVDFMLNALDEVVAEESRTKEEKEQAERDSKIARLRNDIERYEKNLESAKAELAKLTK